MKIEEKTTYNGHICSLLKKINGLGFYSYSPSNGSDSDDEVVIITKADGEVIAEISAILGDGAYGMTFGGYKVEKL